MCEWKVSDAPSVNSWFGQHGHLAALEKLTFRLENKVDRYMLKCWKVENSYYGFWLKSDSHVNSLVPQLVVYHCKTIYVCNITYSYFVCSVCSIFLFFFFWLFKFCLHCKYIFSLYLFLLCNRFLYLMHYLWKGLFCIVYILVCICNVSVSTSSTLYLASLKTIIKTLNRKKKTR